MNKLKRRHRLGRSTPAKTIISSIMILYSFLTVFLVLTTTFSSFKTKQELISNLIGFPKNPTLQNYVTVFIQEKFWRYILNSIFLTGISLILMILVSSMLAYGVAQYKFKGREFIQTYLLIGLMVPVQLSILPLYLMLSKVRMANMFGLMLVYAANLSFSFTIFLRFFEELPVAVMESARIDGASDIMIYTRIVIPISKSVFSTVSLIQFILIWNDFFLPMVFLQRKDQYTLTLAIYQYTCDFIRNWDKIFAAVTVALIPILIIYFIFSEQIIAGLMSGSTKE